MKVLLVLGVLVAAVSASPIAQPRWALVPNSDGNMHVEDLASPVEIEPSFIVEQDIHMLLFTRANPVTPQALHSNTASIQNSNFNPNLPVKVLVHGWLGSQSIPFNIQVTAAYLRQADVNVIVVDWAVGASTINYITARNRAPDVGAFMSRFIDFLHLNSFTQFNRVDVIGFSLGGHVAGFAGKHVTRGRVQHLYGLDPASLLFSVDAPGSRLDRDDALYTESIITNCGTLGFCEPVLTHSTFYPNGGRSQPGCGIDIAGTCAHDRAFEFFAESLNNNNFWAIRCLSFDEVNNNSCSSATPRVRMGGYPQNALGTQGIFALDTNSASPFARG